MSADFKYTITSTRFDENYKPAESTRATTNFANLARGEAREQNLRNALNMIDHRFNTLASWDNPTADRYGLELDIISIDIDIDGHEEEQKFPSFEILKTTVIDHKTGKRIEGIVGNNFSSYVRDYDFSVLLLEHNKGKDGFSVPDGYGDLHGAMFQDFLGSDTYKEHFSKPPVICLSVSDNKTYYRTANEHPVLGAEYTPNEASLTEQYFKKMGLNVRYFKPEKCAAPLAFYFVGDLLNDYTNIEIISTISTMESFQRIYRPEIYNTNTEACAEFKPSLKNADHSLTHIVYDREERTQLAISQGKFAEEHFIKPYQSLLNDWLKKKTA